MMNNARKKVVFIFLVTFILLSYGNTWCEKAYAAGSYSSSDVQEKLNTLKSQYYAGATWNRSFAGGTQCYAFAHYIFNTIFNRGNAQVGNGALSSNPTCYKLNNVASDVMVVGSLAPGYSDAQLEQLLESAAPGDYIQVKRNSTGGPHSMIVMWVDASANQIGIFDANAVAKNTVGQYTQTFSYFKERNAGVTVYRYKNYNITYSGGSCECNTDYAGTYVVSTESLPLTMRSGHGTGYSAVTSIPKGSKVYVSKANGSWAHVEWNGYKGYCSMQYLTKAKAEAEPPNIHAWISDEKMGDVPSYYRTGTGYYLCFELTDPATGKRFNEVADANYKITETFYKPDGSVAFSYAYEKSDNNWICHAPQDAGIYTAKVSIDGDYTGEVSLSFEVKKRTAQWEIWISRTKMGEEADVVPVGKTCYLCYRITDKETKENWDGLYQSNYNVKETIAKSNGEICFSYSYTNDNNWIAITPEEIGEYKGMAEITGDFAGKLDCRFIVKKFYYGDINADDDITVTDLAMVIQAVDNTTVLTADQKKRADVNADGAVTKEDLMLIREFVVGTITEFPAESHVHSYSSSVTKKATCSSTGVRTYSCICGESYTETIVQTGHQHKQIRNAMDATCTEEGYTGDTYCSDCGLKISSGSIIAKKEHKKVTDAAMSATCTQDGKTEGSHCAICGEIIVEQNTIWATGHQHKQIRNAIEATCTEEGYTGDTYCSDCGQKISSGSIVSEKSHIWNSGVVTKTATALEDGIITYTCTVCGEKKVETVPRTRLPGKGTVMTDWQNGAQYKVTKSDVDGGTVEYKRPLNINTTEVIIPETVTFSGITYKVTSIASNAFRLTDNLKKVTIGNNVITIGQNAFANRAKLVSVKMSENLLTIGDGAFYKCKSLTKIIIPSKVKKIGYKAFYNCKNLKSINIKTKKLTLENVGKQSLKGISTKAVIKVPAKKIGKYKKILKAVGVSSRVKIKETQIN